MFRGFRSKSDVRGLLCRQRDKNGAGSALRGGSLGRKIIQVALLQIKLVPGPELVVAFFGRLSEHLVRPVVVAHYRQVALRAPTAIKANIVIFIFSFLFCISVICACC